MTSGYGHFPPQEPNGGPTEPYAAQPNHPGPDFWLAPLSQQYGPPAGMPPTAPRKPRRALATLAAAAVVAAAISAAVIGFSSSGRDVSTSALATPRSPSSQELGGGAGSGSEAQTPPFGANSGGEQTSPYSGGQGQLLPFGNGGSGSNGGRGGTGTTTGSATTAQQVGIVDINTTIDYGQAQAAGTGMILTSNGEILTNNHVVSRATTISITVVSTGKTYPARVVGTDPTDDVAVLALSGASGLATAKLGDSSKVAVGDGVTAVGNAGGKGGVPSAAKGSVTALNQTLTASDEGGGGSETLNGMIEVNADVQPGDSGGPLYSADDKVIGMNTAASTGSQSTSAGYAIPIAKATSIAEQIESGKASSTIHIGSAGFLGVEVADSGAVNSAVAGANVSGVVANSAAAKAGLAQGDTIRAVNGTVISDSTGLTTVINGFKAGQQVSVTWADASGQSHTATVTLGTGPAD